jgi:hypothetical protein
MRAQEGLGLGEKRCHSLTRDFGIFPVGRFHFPLEVGRAVFPETDEPSTRQVEGDFQLGF